MPAKLTAPRLGAIYPRTRLFEILDQSRRHAPLTWVSAPAGAGKTTLIASYLAAHKLGHLWYHVDEGDNDPASFFFHLGLGARHIAPGRGKFPALTSEYLRGLPAFAHNFFRALFHRMNAPSVLVLDGYEAIDPQAVLHALLAKALEETPDAISVIIVSRADPPSAFARWYASNKLEVIGWEALKLRPEETQGICRIHTASPLDAASVRTLHEQTEGWLSGLILMLARSGDRNILATRPQTQSHIAIFDYFAAEIFARSPQAWKAVLLKTALLPHVDPQVSRALTENPEAEAILAELARNNYFIIKLASGAYQYHALFRQFLLRTAPKLFPPEQWRALQRKAAAVLIDADQHEDAAGLLQQAGDLEGLTGLIYQRAQKLVTSGRGRLLEQWLRALPPAWVEAQPWLSYWLGLCRLPFDRAQARACFTRAYSQFKLGDDVNAWLLAWCGAVDSVIFEWGDFRPLDSWLAELETTIEPAARRARPEIAALVAVSAFVALMSRRPDHPDIAGWTERAWLVAMHAEDPALRAKIGPYLLIYLTWWIGDVAKAGVLLETLRPLMDRRDTAPLVQTAWCAMAGAYHWLIAENHTCIEIVEKGLAIASASGVYAWNSLIAAQGVIAALSSGDDQLASHYLQRLAGDLESLRPMDRAVYYYLLAWRFLNQGQYQHATEHAKTALDLAESAGTVFQAAIIRKDYGRALFYQGDEEGARQAVLAAQRIGRSIGSLCIEYPCQLVLAEMALAKGDDETCREALSACLAVGKRVGLRNHTWWNHDKMCRLYVKALEWDIEPDYVKCIIRQRRLTPPTPPLHLDTWPWPIKLYTLGHFRVFRDDCPVRFAGKTQKRPLELLKALIALGGREVREEKLAEALWPDADGDAAMRALATTLHRLRRLLGEDVITRQEGRLSLNPRSVWVDVWALERLAERLDPLVQGRAPPDPETLGPLTARLMGLYRGAFLADQPEPSWALSVRERLRAKFLRVLEAAAEGLAATDPAQAIASCERALDIEPLGEGVYRVLMKASLALGRRAEAALTYERCRKALAALGLAPSPETEAIAHKIRVH